MDLDCTPLVVLKMPQKFECLLPDLVTQDNPQTLLSAISCQLYFLFTEQHQPTTLMLLTEQDLYIDAILLR